ncbi:MAG: polyhydroxyalkanoate synthesis repressor PhaR [Henriciella sp.]|jgi:polyhydroxyalkanoate synthesis repressor PhaR|uniref:polyhydroxyalkanoate synthesis repressor PhaR n=1 Tax=Henriciella sp. TaxID=1968823 RepID=UPI000C0CC61A|nr:polyhydroxyalkanoate synthesis repressor PhaR [Henriciella sp.]MAN72940.1 polyhydroxyalkanoate synthesis repressor PhaR [Henriciella sp.]MBF34759.1 polyhydroxyalkanoate synthesis repressor PhaR [Hyphomonadaceae bacterium]MBK76680.1 polyhydroxyalkanoate synthesis repressor PhaR [Henriciella sp.]PHR82177.1 MAG: polyhydroxyalkanoate synthesis repressor PhaR [Henriciella sp.]|tara:strand:+ start:784 stop:1395 length:612 start_codon:yes stop_codon:yes gene_type:complete
MTKANGSSDTVIIKKYANRRLYDTSTSSYVTLDHLADLVRREVDFEVRDAKSGEDLTRSVLTQIIFEKETKGDGALPLSFLRQLIGFYGGGAQNMLPAWLDMSMNSFAESQERWKKAMGGTHPMAFFEKQTRRNMEMFEQAMKMFAAPAAAASAGSTRRAEPAEPKASSSEKAANEERDEAMAALKAQMQLMQQQLDNLSTKS